MAKDKFKRFHIIIGGDGGYIIRSTNKEEKVESWIEAFVMRYTPFLMCSYT